VTYNCILLSILLFVLLPVRLDDSVRLLAVLQNARFARSSRISNANRARQAESLRTFTRRPQDEKLSPPAAAAAAAIITRVT